LFRLFRDLTDELLCSCPTGFGGAAGGCDPLLWGLIFDSGFAAFTAKRHGGWIFSSHAHIPITPQQIFMRSGSQAIENRANRVLDAAKRFAYSKLMNIDERLERLTERHEALTQSVELLLAAHKTTDSRIERMIQGMEQLSKADARLENVVTQIAEGTARLLRAIEAHEQRISDLEGNQTQQ